MSASKPFRNSVVGLIVNDNCKVLAVERSDFPGSWQFPQGGIEANESAHQAVLREVAEELGVNKADLTVVAKLNGTFEYEFPEGLHGRGGIAKKYSGQKLQAFVLRLLNNAKPNLLQADGEVRSTRWCNPEEVLSSVADFKRKAYAQIVSAFKQWEKHNCRNDDV